MIRNYFYLVVGVLCLLSAVTHEMNGFATVFPTLSNTNIDAESRVTFNYLWHIIATENIVMGIALVLMALRKKRQRRQVYCSVCNGLISSTLGKYCI